MAPCRLCSPLESWLSLRLLNSASGAALRTPGPATAAAANPRSQLSLIVSPAITSPGARVQRRALSNVVRKGRNSALVIYCFDVWRMLMFCRVQHDVDKEEMLRLRREHAARARARTRRGSRSRWLAVLGRGGSPKSV